MKFVLISESDVGYHSDMTNITCEVIPYVFIPQVKKVDDKYSAYVNCRNVFINKAVKEYLSDEIETVFFLGYDLDENGEFMAQALRNYLISKNVKSQDIKRTPLTEDGYVAVSDFLNIDGYMAFCHYQNTFMKKMFKKNKMKMGILDFLSLKYLNEKKGKNIELEKADKIIDINKTSTLTFVINNLLKEDNDEKVSNEQI